MHNKKWFLFALSVALFLGLIIPVDASYTFEEGETQSLEVGGATYAIELLIIQDTTPATVIFKINGMVTGQLKMGEEERLQPGATLVINEIILNEAGESGLGDLVEFSLIEYCGDHVCQEEYENCGGCSSDCSCGSGEYCGGNDCRSISCGDRVCSARESCVEDECCSGRTVTNFETNTAHCGACGVRCSYGELCVDGACQGEFVEDATPVCGDSICDVGETCCTDCGCEEGFACEENVCIQQDSCLTVKDCVDDNPCTLDACKGLPKECSYTIQEGCVVGVLCVPLRERFVIGDTSSFCADNGVVELQREEGMACAFDYECASNDCRDGFCYVERPTFFQRLFSWLRALGRA